MAGWLSNGDIWWSHLKITPALEDFWQDSETSHSKSSCSLGNFQHWYLPDMLASVYTATVWWWKLYLVVCVEDGFSQIQSQIQFFKLSCWVSWANHEIMRETLYLKATVGFRYICPQSNPLSLTKNIASLYYTYIISKLYLAIATLMGMV